MVDLCLVAEQVDLARIQHCEPERLQGHGVDLVKGQRRSETLNAEHFALQLPDFDVNQVAHLDASRFDSRHGEL